MGVLSCWGKVCVDGNGDGVEVVLVKMRSLGLLVFAAV
jgi:hypothetical protein